MKNLIPLLIAVSVLAACQNKKEENPQAANVTIGNIDSVFSKVLNEQRKVWVYVPPHTDTATKYPVLYLLDAEANFSSVVGLIEHLSMANGNTRCPQMIVVGIPNTDRTRDLTTTYVKNMFGDTVFAKTSGGAENFTRFIEEELMPHVDKNYPTTAHRTVIGHSLGGLFVINTLLNHPTMFTNYISIDPSMWWDDQKLLKQSVEIFDTGKFDHKSLYVTFANTMPEGMKISEVQKDTTVNTIHIRSIMQFIETTKTKTSNGLTFESKYYDEDDHTSVPLISEHDAIRSLYSWYTLKGLDSYFDPVSRDSTGLPGKIASHYKTVSDRLGYPSVLPPHSVVEGMGQNFLSTGMNEKAYALFNLNLKNYPENGQSYQAMGDYYIAQKDTVHAVEYYKTALTKSDDPATKEKLKKLEGEER